LREFLHRKAGCADLTSERSSRDFLVIGNRESGARAFFYENDMVAGSGNTPSEFLKRANDFASAHDWKARHQSSVGLRQLEGKYFLRQFC
jgi:hypothetical protein